VFRSLVYIRMVCRLLPLCPERGHGGRISDDDLFSPMIIAAKRGKGHVIAVATQEGTVEIVDTRPRALFSSGKSIDEVQWQA